MRELQAISMDNPIETSFTPIGSNTWSSFPEQPIKSYVAGFELLNPDPKLKETN
jgi:hypothetical protein